MALFSHAISFSIEGAARLDFFCQASRARSATACRATYAICHAAPDYARLIRGVAARRVIFRATRFFFRWRYADIMDVTQPRH